MAFNFVNGDIDAGAVRPTLCGELRGADLDADHPVFGGGKFTAIAGATSPPPRAGRLPGGEVRRSIRRLRVQRVPERDRRRSRRGENLYQARGHGVQPRRRRILAGAQQVAFSNNVSVSLVANTTGSALAANNAP